jgi:hypothetical protein
LLDVEDHTVFAHVIREVWHVLIALLHLLEVDLLDPHLRVFIPAHPEELLVDLLVIRAK